MPHHDAMASGKKRWSASSLLKNKSNGVSKRWRIKSSAIFRGREMVVVSLLNGTVMFLADLMRHINLPLRLDFLGVSSYGLGTESGEAGLRQRACAWMSVAAMCC